MAARRRPAEAEAFRPALGLARREALWSLKGLRDEPLPLFAAASAKAKETVTELDEPAVQVRSMTDGSEVVADYSHTGLSLRSHPVSFLRADLTRHRIICCSDEMQAPDRRWVEAAGLVLVRQRPDSAKGVKFIIMEDETASRILSSGQRYSNSIDASSCRPACSPSTGASSAKATSSS